ncbi:class I SAM-dependent methyltransferase [Asaia siamensis]
MGDGRVCWDEVYSRKAATELSWYEAHPDLSLKLILDHASARRAAVDIGGGVSFLPDALLDAGFDEVTSLDLSSVALKRVAARLKTAGARFQPVVADVTEWEPGRVYDVWHDRAALHFLTAPEAQARYARVLRKALSTGGIAVIATFAPDGPTRCSGLPVVRHDAASLASLLGEGFTLLAEQRHTHHTPGGARQNFQSVVFQKTGGV